ncbi:MAG: hypothetical protein HYZ28_09770 [Myxococcales bacterium]|nr:hypothetical protein [Myxococcales bacterium]
MRGVITTRDVVVNLGLIWREFGTVCVLRCLRALLRGEPTTFLDVALKAHR